MNAPRRQIFYCPGPLRLKFAFTITLALAGCFQFLMVRFFELHPGSFRC